MIKDKYNKKIVLIVMSIIILLTLDFKESFLAQGNTLIIIFLLILNTFISKIRFYKIKDIIYIYIFLWGGLCLIAFSSSLFSYYSSIKSITTGILIFASTFLFIFLLLDDSKPISTFKIISKCLIIYSVLLCIMGLIVSYFGTQPITVDSYVSRQFFEIGPLKLSQITIGPLNNYGIALMTSNPNLGGMIVSIACIVTIHLFFSTFNKSKKYIYFILICLQFSGVIFTDSRGSIFNLLLMSVLYLFLLLKNRWLKIIIGFYTSTIIILIYLTSKILNPFENTLELTGRGEIWSSLIESFINRPFLGLGISGSNLYLQERGFFLSSHSSQLLILSEFGIIGYLFFIIITIIAFYSLYKKSKTLKSEYKKYSYLFCVLLIGIFVNSFVENSILTFSALHYIYIFIDN